MGSTLLMWFTPMSHVQYNNHVKLCFGCKQVKPLTDFANNLSRKDKIQTYCRVCKAKYDHSYYSKNREGHYLRIKRLLGLNRKKLLEYLSLHPCIDCGERNPVVLEFDHVKKGKTGNISYMLGRLRCSWPTVVKEIEKCEVRCANCHRIKTFKQFGWTKSLGV